MKTLIQSALIVDPGSSHHGKKRDILIHDGKIIKIAAKIEEPKAKTLASQGLMVSPGWTDLHANFCDPGLEYKEDLQSGIAAAKRGGFSHVVLMPSTIPVTDNKGAVEYLKKRSATAGVAILPAGALSEGMEGKQLSEMYDMHGAGAVAFTDDKQNVSTELLSRALEYSKNFGGLIMSFPFDKGVSTNGQMHEGAMSVAMGTKGIPSVAEEIRVQRDIELLRYCGGRLHFSLISTARSVELIRKAKKEGLQVTCAIAAHQLMFTDEDLKAFDSNYKVLPPFRTKEDKKALVAGLKDGTIDAICSDHTPEDVEHKIREFEDANFGVSSIESTFCTAWTVLEKYMSVEEVVSKLTSGPNDVLGINTTVIEEGSEVDITVFSATENTIFNESNWISKSKNSPVIGLELRGKVYQI